MVIDPACANKGKRPTSKDDKLPTIILTPRFILSVDFAKLPDCHIGQIYQIKSLFYPTTTSPPGRDGQRLAYYDRVAGAAQDPRSTFVEDLVPKRWVVGPRRYLIRMVVMARLTSYGKERGGTRDWDCDIC